MVFKDCLIDFFSSLLIVLHRVILLIISPYKSMRKISQEKDSLQIVILLGLIFLYFQISSSFRKESFPGYLIFGVFLFDFLLTAFFFHSATKVFRQKTNFSSYVFTFAYSLIPTLIWFVSNFILYLVLPPPRTMSILGKGFTVFFTAFSLSLLLWKLILFYLSIRFSSSQSFYRILYMIFVYLCWFIPYSLLLYYLRIFRVPFI